MSETADVVELETAGGLVFGRGVVRYSSKNIDRIAGQRSSEIVILLGPKSPVEAIDRNDLVVWS